MVSSFLLLAIIALGNAKPLGLDNDLGRGDLGRSDWPSDSEAFRVRSRDLLRQGYKLTVEDVKPIASASLDQGEYFPF
jgi:hypothetical protein